jgi:molecular chaperone DnaK (HSP70)
MSKIGIDFGTTNSALGRITPDGKSTLVGPLPSVGAWKNGKAEFFFEAKEALRSADDTYHPIRDLKMMLGLKDITIGRERISSYDLSRQMIGDMVTRSVKGNVELTVLSTPVKFSEQRRSALLAAAAGAGLASVKLVYEPTAALIGALSESDVTDGVSVIVDWGGGTLDIAVVVKAGNSFRELAVSGDVEKLGGSQIDKKLANFLLAEHPDVEKVVSGNEGYYDRFLEEVEDEKISFLEDIDGEDAEARIFAPAWAEGEIVMLEPGLVYSVLHEFAESAAEQILALLRENHVNVNEITHVVFAGGVCNSPEVRKTLFGLFPRALEIVTQNPQLITAAGCTALAGSGFNIELAASFGVRQSDDSICCILPEGMSLETSSFRTAEFLLTDVYAPEAIFEFGITRERFDSEQSLSMTSSSFSALENLFLPVAVNNKKLGGEVADRIRIYAGIDESLTVKVHAESIKGSAAKTMAVSGVPLAIHMFSQN